MAAQERPAADRACRAVLRGSTRFDDRYYSPRRALAPLKQWTGDADPSEPVPIGDCDGFRLKDRTPVRIRRVLPSDRTAVLDFLRHLSRDSLELRFFSPVQKEVVIAEILREVGAGDRVSLVMETLDFRPSRIVTHGESIRSRADATTAEVAFLIADDHQRRGAGTLLLWQLARRARDAGIRSFEAVALSENPAMLGMFVASGLPCTIAWNSGEARVTLDVSQAPTSTVTPFETSGGGVTLAI